MILSDQTRYGMALARNYLRSALEALPSHDATITARRILPSLIRDFDERIGTGDESVGTVSNPDEEYQCKRPREVATINPDARYWPGDCGGDEDGFAATDAVAARTRPRSGLNCFRRKDGE